MKKVEIVLKRITALNFEPPTDPVAFASIKDVIVMCREKHNDFVKVTLQPPYRKRTTGYKSQSHRINGFIAQICEATGNDFDDLKMYVKKRAIRRGYPVKTNRDGDPMYSIDTGDPIPESESNLNTVEAGLLNDEIEQLAAELGVILKE